MQYQRLLGWRDWISHGSTYGEFGPQLTNEQQYYPNSISCVKIGGMTITKFLFGSLKTRGDGEIHELARSECNVVKVRTDNKEKKSGREKVTHWGILCQRQQLEYRVNPRSDKNERFDLRSFFGWEYDRATIPNMRLMNARKIPIPREKEKWTLIKTTLNEGFSLKQGLTNVQPFFAKNVTCFIKHTSQTGPAGCLNGWWHENRCEIYSLIKIDRSPSTEEAQPRDMGPGKDQLAWLHYINIYI